MLIKGINPLNSGLQQGAWLTFEIMTSEFVQIVHTGHSQRGCVSNIGCDPGGVNLYDSLQIGVSDSVKNKYLKKINLVDIQHAVFFKICVF